VDGRGCEGGNKDGGKTTNVPLDEGRKREGGSVVEGKKKKKKGGRLRRVLTSPAARGREKSEKGADRGTWAESQVLKTREQGNFATWKGGQTRGQTRDQLGVTGVGSEKQGAWERLKWR